MVKVQVTVSPGSTWMLLTGLPSSQEALVRFHPAGMVVSATLYPDWGKRLPKLREWPFPSEKPVGVNPPPAVKPKEANDRSGLGSVTLRKMIAPYREAGRNIAELGIGTNEKAIVTGVVLEDEKAMGTVHVALGDNASMGGTVHAPIHLDGVVLKPTLMVDETVILEAGKLMI